MTLQQHKSMGLSSGGLEYQKIQHDMGPSFLYQLCVSFWKEAKGRMTNQQQIARLQLLDENLVAAPSSVHT
jgi:hypothetical protein